MGVEEYISSFDGKCRPEALKRDNTAIPFELATRLQTDHMHTLNSASSDIFCFLLFLVELARLDKVQEAC